MANVIYMRLPSALGSAIPGGKRGEARPREGRQGAGIDLGALQQSGGNDLGQYLDFLREPGGARVVGRTRSARAHHHYAGTSTSRRPPPAGRRGQEGAPAGPEHGGVSSIPVDVWVDRDQLVRRMTMEFARRRRSTSR